jgi:alkylhydroperoxidase family enzyme
MLHRRRPAGKSRGPAIDLSSRYGSRNPDVECRERAALALAEAATRLADREDPVPDAIRDEAARHYDEKGLAALVLAIAVANVFNRLNRVTRQPAGHRW